MTMMIDGDIVATWNVPMSNKLYKIEFFHGTTTGKRILRVNGREILRREWMFKLVGREFFELNNVKCVITIEAIGIFAYEYSLQVGGKSFEKFRDEQNKAIQVWHVSLVPKPSTAITPNDDIDTFNNQDVRVCLGIKWFLLLQLPLKSSVLEKDSMDVWINGTKTNATGEFMDNGGTRTHFQITADMGAYIESESSGKRNVGIVHKLFVNGNFIASTTDDAFTEAN